MAPLTWKLGLTTEDQDCNHFRFCSSNETNLAVLAWTDYETADVLFSRHLMRKPRPVAHSVCWRIDIAERWLEEHPGEVLPTTYVF